MKAQAEMPSAKFVARGTFFGGFGDGTGIDADALLSTHRVRLVHGRAWTGKTHFATAYAQYRSVPYLNLLQIRTTTIVPPSASVVVCDALDEAMSRDPTIATRLLSELRDRPDVKAIITCRSGEVPPRFDEELASLNEAGAASTRVELAAWQEHEAKAAIEGRHPGVFERFMAFMRERSLNAMFPFPRPMFALAARFARDELRSIDDEQSARREALAELLRETNRDLQPLQTESFYRDRVRLLARATAVMAMTGATGLTMSEAADTSALLVRAAVPNDARAVEHALNAVGTSVSTSLWMIEPAHLRTWLIVEGLSEVPDRNILPLLTPLSHRGSAEVLRDLLRFRPQLQKRTSFADFVEATLSDPDLTDAVHAIDIAHAPASLGEDLARRIADETKAETVRRSMLSMVTRAQASAVLPVARNLVLASTSLELKHEALGVVIQHGENDDISELLRLQPSLDDEDRGWLFYEAAKRELIDLSGLIWEIPSTEREHFVGFWRLLSKRIVAALSHATILEVFKRIAQECRWPGTSETAADLIDRLESDRSLVSPEMVGLLLRIVETPWFEEPYRLWNLLSVAADSHPESRKLVLQHWLDGGRRFLYVQLNDDDIRWMMTLAFEPSTRTDEVLSAALAGVSESFSSTVTSWAEATRPGIGELFKKATAAEHGTVKRVEVLERVQTRHDMEREAAKRPIATVVTKLLEKELTAERWRELIWSVIPPQHQARSTDIVGAIDDLDPEHRALVVSALVDCLRSSATVPSGSDSSFFLLEQELLLWLLSPASGVEEQAWLTADVVRRFLPGVLNNQYGGVGGVVTAMFNAHPGAAAEASRAALQRNLDERLDELPVAWSIPSHVLVDPITEALLRRALSTPQGAVERKLLRVLSERHPDLACEVASAWLENDRLDHEVLDALAIAAPRMWFTHLKALEHDQRRSYLGSARVLGDFQRRHTTGLFAYDEAAAFFLWLEDVYPGQPILRSGYLSGEDIAREWKSSALNRVWSGFDSGDPGATEELTRLAAMVPRLVAPFARDRARRHLRTADRTVVADGRGVWGSLSLRDALMILDSKNAYTKNADDLLDALVDELSLAFADAVSEDGELLFLVDEDPVKPRREAAWQAYLARYLRLRLPGAFFGREVHVRVDSDPDVVAVPLGTVDEPAGQVVIEVKLTDNTTVLDAIDTQLTRYTDVRERRHGIYLVVYLEHAAKPGKMRLKAKNPCLADYRTFLEERARSLHGDRHLRVVVIDALQPKPRRKAKTASKRKTASKKKGASKKSAAKKTAKKTAAKKTVAKLDASQEVTAKKTGTKAIASKPTAKKAIPKNTANSK